MRRSILTLLILTLFLPTFLIVGGESNKISITNFKVEIIRYYFGRENIRVVVTHEQLMCETALSLNQKDYTLVKRILTDEESSGLKKFLSGFPLEDFKETYYNKGVKDGMQIGFTININGVEKDIYVANYYIKELGDLVAEVTKLLTKDHLGYNSGSVPEGIER